MSLSIFIPCRNEDKIIVHSISNLVKKIKISDYEIILINDYSTDKTEDFLKLLQKKYKKVKYFNNNLNPGLGSSFNTALKKASKSFFCIYMSDMSDDIKNLEMYYRLIVEKDLDAIFGSRFLKQSKVYDYPKSKLLFNRIFNFFIKILFWSDYNDFTNAFKMYKLSVLKKLIPIVLESFNVFLEIPLKIISRNYSYKIVPINWTNRKIGKSKFIIAELGSRYIFTALYCWLEKVLLLKRRK